MTAPWGKKRAHSPGKDPASTRGKSRIGELIAGRYRIDRKIASGGFAAVYGGQHVHMGHRVAIKVLHPKAENLPGLVERFRREAIVGAHVRHPNIAAAIDYGTLDDGSYYLVLEHVDGETLKRAVKQDRLPMRRAVAIARQLADALDAVHAMGIVHRDLKPANVMLVHGGKGRGPEETVKLIDFGFAKVAAEQLASFDLPEPIAALSDAKLTVDGMMFGTVAYMSPEAFHGMDAVGARSDLYALGLLLYEMVTGKRPFPGETDAEVFQKKLEATPPPLADCGLVGPGLAELEAITTRLLNKDADRRIQTAQEVVEALDAVTASQTEPTDAPLAGETVEEGEPSDAAPTSEEAEQSAPSLPREREEAQIAPGGPRHRPALMAVGALVAVGAAGLGVIALALHLVRGGQQTALERADYLPPATTSAASSTSPLGSAAPGGLSDAAARAPHPQARAWRQRLQAADKARDWMNAYRAFRELARIEPAAFGDPLTRAAAGNTLSALAQTTAAEADAMMRILEGELGPAGPDVLFHVVQFRGGTKARERALASLERPEVLGLASPALRVALDLRAAGCNTKPGLLRRAVAEGDGRALLVLQLRRDTCAPSHERDTAFRELEARLSARKPE